MAVADALELYLKPILGDTAAHHLILRYCSESNKIPANLTDDDLPAVGRYLRKNLELFVGKRRADYVFSYLIAHSFE